MDVRRKIVMGTFLVATGVGAGVVFQKWIVRGVDTVLPATDDAWATRVRSDAIEFLKLVPPGRVVRAEGNDEFETRWAARRAEYPTPHLARLGEILHDYIDFIQAEHADCAEIWLSGRPPAECVSDAAREARRRVTAGFGDFATRTLLPQADALREEAYRASPRVAGLDPDATDFEQEYPRIRDWAGVAHVRIDELTGPAPRR